MMRVSLLLIPFVLAAAVSAAPGDSLDRELRALEAQWSAPDTDETAIEPWLDRLATLEPRAFSRAKFWSLWGRINLQAGRNQDASLGFSIARRMGFQPRLTRLLLVRALLDWSFEFPRGPGDKAQAPLNVLQRCRGLVEEGLADESLSAAERGEYEVLDLQSLSALGSVLRWSLSYVAAEETFRELVRRQPGVARYRIGLGRTLLALKKTEEALRVVEEAQRINPDPDWLEPDALLGTIHSRLGHEELAEMHYARFLAGNPDHKVVLKRLGDHYSRYERFGPAAEAYLRLLELSPTDAGVCFSLAQALRRLGRTEEAEKYMARHRELSAEIMERRGVREGGD